MHLCPECNTACNCSNGETDVENCAHILTRGCTGGDDDAEDAEH